jgi:ketosteroid isomerase-like protein
MSTTADTKTVVDAYYQAAVRGELRAFAPYVAPDITITAPNFLPWGGTHVGASFFIDTVFQQLPKVADFNRFAYDSFIAENNRAVAVFTVGITDTSDTVTVSELWEVKDGLAQSIWVAYFEPQVMLDKLQLAYDLPYFGL